MKKALTNKKNSAYKINEEIDVNNQKNISFWKEYRKVHYSDLSVPIFSMS